MTESEFSKNNPRQEDEYKLMKHSVRHKQKQRFVRKKRKKIDRIKTFSRLTVFLAIIYSIYRFFTLSGWYLPQDTFKNPNSGRIEIINNQIVPTYVINNAIKEVKVPEFPIFIMKLTELKKALYKLPTTKNVFIRRYGFPARIQIIIHEREPVAIIKTDLNAKPSIFFTADEKLITHENYMKLGNYSYALKIIATAQSIKNDITPSKIHEIEQIVKYVERYSDQKVQYIDFRNPNDVFVRIKTTSIRLGTIDSTIEERIKRIYTILPQISKVNSEIKYIDLSWDKVNYLKLKKNKTEN